MDTGRHRGLDLDTLPLYVITVPTLRLDLERDQRRLYCTVAQLRPRLLLLDPFVRLHNINENDAGEVSNVLAYLRQLQRTFDVAVIVVHHSRKNGRPGGAGANLRGSSDFHAWSDSSLYLHDHKGTVILTPEHRTASAPGVVNLRLHADQQADDAHFEVVESPNYTGDAATRLEDDVLTALADGPLSRNQMRATLRVRNQRLGTALHRLAQAGRIVRHDHNTWTIPIPAPTEQRERNRHHAEQQLPLSQTP